MSTSVPKAWTPPDRRVLILVCVFLLAANVFDAYHTLRLIDLDGGKEANPLMRHLMACDRAIFWAAKIGVPLVVGPTCAIVILNPRAKIGWRRSLWYALCIVSALYAIIVAHFLYIYVLVLLFPSG